MVADVSTLAPATVNGMCGRYTNTAEPHALEQRFGLRLDLTEGTRRYNVAPTEPVIAVVRVGDAPPDAADDATHEARLMRWGLVPRGPSRRPGATR